MYYCGIDKEPEFLLLEDIKKLKVCNSRDNLSNISSLELIKKHKNFNFYERIKHIPIRFKGSFIRWLYRGLTFEQAKIKVNNEMSYQRNVLSHRFPSYENSLII